VHNQDPTQPHFSILELQCLCRLLERAGEKRALPKRFPVLFWAVKLNKPDTIRDLLQCAFDVNEVNYSMGTPLYFAITQGHLQSVAMLLSMGAAVNDVSQQPIPLLTAAEFGRDEILTLLVERGANLQCFNVQEQCALVIATKAGRHSTMELLLHHGAAAKCLGLLGENCIIRSRKGEEIAEQLCYSLGPGPRSLEMTS
jgi:ankyrin repeat protein